jgi:SOS-response transcriptional repressor LexA
VVARAPLTRRQHEVYDYVAGYVSDNGYGPTLDEIAGWFGYSSMSTAHEHVATLVRKGWLRKGDANEPRNVTVALDTARWRDAIVAAAGPTAWALGLDAEGMAQLFDAVMVGVHNALGS